MNDILILIYLWGGLIGAFYGLTQLEPKWWYFLPYCGLIYVTCVYTARFFSCC